MLINRQDMPALAMSMVFFPNKWRGKSSDNIPQHGFFGLRAAVQHFRYELFCKPVGMCHIPVALQARYQFQCCTFTLAKGLYLQIK